MSKRQRNSSSSMSSFFAGAVGGTLGAVFTCPLEVVKTKLQGMDARNMYKNVQLSSVGNSNGKILQNRSWLSTPSLLSNIVRSEGIRGLYRGLPANVIGVAPARAIYFVSYKEMKSLIGIDHSLTHFVSAAASGAITATVTCPIWLIKTRIQLQSDTSKPQTKNPVLRNYTGYSDAIKRIAKEEGIVGFYKGLTASYWNVFEGALQFMLYEKLKSSASMNGREPTKFEIFSLAAGSKLIAASLTYPLELVRTRLREQRAGMTKYNGVIQTLQIITKEEGALALYGGLEAHLLRVVPNAAIMFLAVELILSNNL